MLGRMVPSKKPTEFFRKPVPLMKSVKSALPATILPGEIVLRIGVAGGSELLLEQPAIRNATKPRRATAVHRERLKQLLLNSFR